MAERRTARPRTRVHTSDGFPFKPIWDDFLDRYRRIGGARLYFTTGRKVTDRNLDAMRRVVDILANDEAWRDTEWDWDHDAQTAMLDQLVDEKVLNPYRDDQSETDANALVRMMVTVLKRLGLVREETPGNDSLMNGLVLGSVMLRPNVYP